MLIYFNLTHTYEYTLLKLFPNFILICEYNTDTQIAKDKRANTELGRTSRDKTWRFLYQKEIVK